LYEDEHVYFAPVLDNPFDYMERMENIRWFMQYLLFSRRIRSLEMMLNSDRFQDNRKNKDFIKIFKLFVNYYNMKDIIEELHNYSPKHPETKALKLILSAFIAHREKNYIVMYSYYPRLISAINDVTDVFLHDSFLLQAKQINMCGELYVNTNFPVARKLAMEIISSKICAEFKTESYYIVGTSYMFVDFEKSMHNYEEYRKQLIEYGRVCEAEIVKLCDEVFLKILHGKIDRSEINDMSELAHYEARWGNRDTAQKLAEQSIERYGYSIFRDYYLSLAKMDGSELFRVLVKMLVSGKRIYACMVYKSLQAFSDFQIPSKILMENYKLEMVV
jgi:hypothetical protein